MTTPLPFDVFSSELLPGETVQWTGRPNTAVILHKEDWGVIPFSLLWGGFAIFWLLGASGMGNLWTNRPDKTFQWFGVIWGTPFVLMGQYMIWGRFVYNYWEKQRTYYALTTRRALIVVNGFRGRTASSAYFENMTIIDKSVRHDGIGRISFGGTVSGEWRWGRNNPPRPPTFDDIDSADSVYQIVARLREQAISGNAVERGEQDNIEAMPAGICRKPVQAETFRPRVSLVGKPRCKLRCKFRAQTSPEEQGCDQTEGPENKQDGEFQSDS